MNDLEKDALTRELQDRSHDIGGHPIGLGDVKQSARRIQRRRRIASGFVAAAVLAVAVPTSIAVTNGINNTAPGPVEQPTPSVTQTATPDGPVTLALEDLSRGEDPQRSYFDNGDLVTPDGVLEFPVSLQSATPYGEGWIGLGYDGQGSAEVFMFDADLNITNRQPTNEVLAVSPDGSQIAYVVVEEDGTQTLVNAPADGSEPVTWSFGERPVIRPIGFVSASEVLYQTEEERSVVGIASSEGLTVLEGFINSTSANPDTGLVTGQTSSSDTGSCWAVMDPATSTTDFVWDTCEYSLVELSPDGRHVIATSGQDGLGLRDLSILDARTGDPVVSYEQGPRSTVSLVFSVWEDSDSLLSIATPDDGRTWTMVRMDTSGALEEVIEPVDQEPNSDWPFWFPVI
ncbi:MAG TPA: hypothetical protein VJ819_03785 [Nocardioidaceae bacterium]|nr:hypothetical protein [Nocardioidaceae bacterium]